jgi:hypothetical protein
MSGDAEVITAVAALFGNTLAVVVGAWLAARAARAATAAKLAAETVHTIVNSQRTIMCAKVQNCGRTLGPKFRTITRCRYPTRWRCQSR